MICVKLDSSKMLVAFELGNLKRFNERYAGQPDWVFVDKPAMSFRVDIADFLKYPTTYGFDSLGTFIKLIN